MAVLMRAALGTAIVTGIAFVVNALVNDWLNSVVTFALIFAGLPVYQFCFSSLEPQR